MATYTPNLNLGKPEATDAFGNFRQLFNDNMDILDNGGGGGSGGHTIIDPNGNSLPQESGLQFTGGVTVTDDSVNGKTVVDISGGGGNVYGAFIDTNRLITSGQYSSGSPLSYTATEDCFVYGVCTLTNNTSGSVSIDGVQVGGWYNGGGTTAYNFGFLVKNGQTITASQTFSGNSDYKVYGLTQGTSGIFTPIIYSDTERVVGVWRDNKPLYQKSTHIGAISANASSAFSVGVGANVVETMVSYNVIAYVSSGAWVNLPQPLPSNISSYASYVDNYNKANDTITIITGADRDFSDAFVTVQYTKSSDSAGSGNWNTDGVPTVHYSTSEQVIGTWIDGKPLYEKTINYGALPSTPNVERDVSHGIPDVDTIWIADGFATNGTFVNQLNLSGVNNAEWFFGVTATYIRCMAQSDRSNYSAYVVLRYTKVTD